MKKILITGKGSYIGTNLKTYLEDYPDDYYVEEIDVKDSNWKEFDFSPFDVVYHVAGIAHMKERKENESLYYAINRDLSIEIAKKAKKSGVKQFIFMSSMSVYGILYSNDPIDKMTPCFPNTYYGISKYQAEQGLRELENNDFQICILRPPMVYGNDSPGNLTKLFNTVKKIHLFPKFKNQRSSITIENLVQQIKIHIDNKSKGLFLPQNTYYLCTYEIVKEKMSNDNIKVVYTTLFNPIIKIMIGKNSLITKCFGDLIYEQ